MVTAAYGLTYFILQHT